MENERVSLVAMGEIATTHGLDGWLKLNPYNPQTEALVAGRRVFLGSDEGLAEHEIEIVKPFNRQFLIKLSGIDHIDQAKSLIGQQLRIDASSLAALGEDEYYHYQVMGFEVLRRDRQRVGIIAGLLSHGGQDLYSVRTEQNEILIPAVKEIVISIDFAAREVIIDPPEGLLEL